MAAESAGDFTESPRTNKEKVRRAAQHPGRPGEKCRAEAGVYVPLVDRNACEGKRDCVEVCPYDVFEVRRIDDRDFAKLSMLGKLKSRMHGKLTAYTPKANLCQACGLCVVACPEDAITLVSHREWLQAASL
jgi:NAD-dependent dihydropyrimidine dehydrogenase PreA subunit